MDTTNQQGDAINLTGDIVTTPFEPWQVVHKYVKEMGLVTIVVSRGNLNEYIVRGFCRTSVELPWAQVAQDSVQRLEDTLTGNIKTRIQKKTLECLADMIDTAIAVGKKMERLADESTPSGPAQ